MKTMRGTASYWNVTKNDLFSMIKSLGPPTWFITLSANDLNWTGLLIILCQQAGLPHTRGDKDRLTRMYLCECMFIHVHLILYFI